MSIPGNPRQFARDVADGYFVFSPSTCRQLAPPELKVLHQQLEIVQREIRAETVPLEDVVAVQRRNLRLGRASTALMLVRSHAKRLRIPL